MIRTAPAGGIAVRSARGGAFAEGAGQFVRAGLRRRLVRAAAPKPATAAAPRAVVVAPNARTAVRIAFSPQGLVVALACAPEHRARAAGALERARLALAARGIATVRILS